jgi:ketosteroid isomerase-like protein
MRRSRTLAVGLAVLGMSHGQAAGAPQASTQANRSEAGAKPDAKGKAPHSDFDLDKYFSEMEEDVSVYDPASPWIYEGKGPWRKRVDQMMRIRQFNDLNQFHKTEVELGDMKIVTIYRELRRVEGSMTSRLHGRITWVYLKQPDGRWYLWHDHTSEVPGDYSYSK